MYSLASLSLFTFESSGFYKLIIIFFYPPIFAIKFFIDIALGAASFKLFFILFIFYLLQLIGGFSEFWLLIIILS